ncbi:MAG: hypothetical protein ABII08_00650 [Candidatus Beckwithbacteria bacterium]
MWKKILAFFLLLLLSVVQVKAEDCDNLSVSEKVTCYQNKLNENQGQQKTLASTIAFLNSKMALTQAQINQTEEELKKLEEEISILSVKIVRLDENLDNISKLLVSRIGAAYKRSLFKPIYMVFATGGLSDFFERNKYLQSVQQNDRVVLLELQNSKDLHEEQKQLEEEKQKQAEALKQQLATQNSTLLTQKQSKQQLLETTKNDEKTYQYLLSVAKEQQQASAIQCLGGKITYNIGNLASKGDIGAGNRVGTMGNTGSPGCSTGAHLHFDYITEGKFEGNNLTGVIINPLSFLSNQTIKWFTDENYIAEGSFGSGGNIWPLNNSIITQFFGQTKYSSRYSCGIHTGLDTVDLDNRTIRAAKGGKLYIGTLVCNSGSSLINTAIIDHGNGVFTAYLHLDSF